MASDKQQRIRERLDRIKNIAAGLAANPKQTDAQTAANLAEEAAGLGLELADIIDAKGK